VTEKKEAAKKAEETCDLGKTLPSGLTLRQISSSTVQQGGRVAEKEETRNDGRFYSWDNGMGRKGGVFGQWGNL